MDWIKIKTHHVFYDGFNKTTLWAWIRIMALTAELEAIPNERQILTTVTQREYKLLVKHLEGEGKLLSNILQRVLEDALSVKEKRDYWKKKKRIQREKSMPVPLDVNGESHTREDKSIVDKSRVDNINNISGEITKIINYYNKKFDSNYSILTRDVKYGSIELLIKTARLQFDLSDIFKAIDNFKNDEFFKEKRLHRPVLLFKDTATVEKYINADKAGNWRDKYKKKGVK